jgi:tetratricopeptide (TPR) repeat protein
MAYSLGKLRELLTLQTRRTSAQTGKLCVLALLMVLAWSGGARADARDNDCFGDDFARRVEACSALINSPQTSKSDLALAYSARALAYSVKGNYELAIPDYVISLRLDPNSAVALNNRAWAYYKLGQPERGAGDVERALDLMPDSPHTLDTRAHIRQSRGDLRGAMRDYENAMRLGGSHIIKLYQCGLQAQSLFAGEIDGLYTSDMRKAMETCVATTGCDPLPPDEECLRVTS